MKRNILHEIKNDIWVLILDIIAVNAGYLFALLIRYYLRFRLVNAAQSYLLVYERFAPIYTVLCIVVFSLFRLYNGLWRYAGISDMNRIICANVVTAALYVLLTRIFFQRLPLLYYAIGAAVQFVLVSAIRFAYRFLTSERQRIAQRKLPARNVMLVGADNAANEIIKYLESDSSLRPVVVVDAKSKGKTMRGLPVVEDYEEALGRFGVECIIVADPTLPDSSREKLRRLCEAKNIEIHDYTGFLENRFGRLPLTELTKVIDGKAALRIGDQEYDNLETAMENLKGRYIVRSIKGKDLLIEIQPEEQQPMEEWAKKYKEETGEDVSFF